MSDGVPPPRRKTPAAAGVDAQEQAQGVAPARATLTAEQVIRLEVLRIVHRADLDAAQNISKASPLAEFVLNGGSDGK